MSIMQIRRGSASVLAANNRTYAAGQLVLEKDTGRMKVADGTTAWSALPYLPVFAPAFTVANLPAGVADGQLAFATDGRKAGEGVGSGTGVLAYYDGAAWCACHTSAPVEA